jgi:hypothetical protein
MQSLPAPARARLDALGLHSPEKVLRALRDAPGREEWSRRSGLAAAELEAVRDCVALVMHTGLGDRRAAQLEALGIRCPEDLKRWNAAALAAALRGQGPTSGDRFLERRVLVWLRAAAGSSTVNRASAAGPSP